MDMKNPVVKWFVGVSAISIVLTLALVAYVLSSMSMSTLVLCSAGEGGIRIPASVCETHMRLFRSSESDIKELRYGGLDPVLNMKDERKYKIARFLIENGLDVDEPNQYGDEDSDATPLHLSVLYNDPERARFLLDQGADPDAESDRFDGMTPLELARHFRSTDNDREFQAIIEVFESRVSREH
ncbi:hypothetical protein CK501_03520 [Halovibrio salipaludis]|uniref:Uncharacterized protein n=1 Tax=Halovibrio salipaludis TaxID=2032626 RepID=A0A2A2FBX0_9GAMM|nr:ankyrin repeat domain-containing protein [Halovibrio salipaludis]PAU82224.1 hypothetical protein CK501_03520 [Halovibrio salipaludis]